METELKDSIEELKNGTYGLSKTKNSQAFKTGAIIGFFGGAVVGWLTGGRIITYGLIGLVAIGYVGYKISDASELKTEFQNFSKLNLNLKTSK